jgi:hypothetical protein
MNYPTITILALAAALTVSCNKEKTAIDDNTSATKEVIETRKDEVADDAKYATEQIDKNAAIDKARVEADKVSDQAQLEAEKKKVEAEAAAAKARVDAENQ